MNELIELMKKRTSCKSYEDKHVDSLLLDEIIQCGLHAPSGMNRQSSIIVKVTNDEMVKRLSNLNASILGISSDPFFGAKDILIVLGDKSVPTYLYDGSLVMENLLLASSALSLGACWIHRCKEVFQTEEGKKILELFGISKEVEGIGFCIVGYINKRKQSVEIKENRVFKYE